jgi:hypothetical protein
MGRTTKTCSHKFVDGDTCGARRLHGEEYCHYHLRYKRSRNPNDADYELPLLEDKDSVQVVVRDIMRGILKGDIDSRKGNLLLYATQIASNNLARWKKIPDDSLMKEVEPEKASEKPKEPIMIKILREALGDLTFDGGPEHGKPAIDVLLKKIEEAKVENK